MLGSGWYGCRRRILNVNPVWFHDCMRVREEMVRTWRVFWFMWGMKRKERVLKKKPLHTWELPNVPFIFFIHSWRPCLNATTKNCPLPCTFALFGHGMRFLTLGQESFDHKVHFNDMNAAGEVDGCLLIVVSVVYESYALKLQNSVKETQSMFRYFFFICKDLEIYLRVEVVYFKWHLNIWLLKWKEHINRKFSYSGFILKRTTISLEIFFSLFLSLLSKILTSSLISLTIGVRH